MTIAERLGLGNRGKKGQEEAPTPAVGYMRPDSRIPRDVFIVVIILLSSSASFGLGVLAGKESGEGEGGDDFWIESLSQSAPTAAVAESEPIEAQKQSAKVMLEEPPAPASGGAYVASKSGTKYYLPWCGTAKRINEENKVWFATKAEAEAAGYEPAKNCKGI